MYTKKVPHFCIESAIYIYKTYVSALYTVIFAYCVMKQFHKMQVSAKIWIGLLRYSLSALTAVTLYSFIAMSFLGMCPARRQSLGNKI